MFEKTFAKNKNGKAAVFIDRDGTINDGTGLVCCIGDFRLIPSAAEGIKLINKLGLPTIVVSNQPVIARGLCSRETVEEIHAKMEKLLAEKGARLDAVYYCPHSRLAGVPEYRKDCPNRKPKTGMLEKAAREFGLDLEKCFMVGDSVRDVLTGKRAGCITIGVETGDGCKDRRDDVEDGIKPQYMAKDLLDAARLIERILKQ